MADDPRTDIRDITDDQSLIRLVDSLEGFAADCLFDREASEEELLERHFGKGAQGEESSAA